MWVVWIAGAVVLVAAGLAGVAVPRWRAAAVERRTAWSAAHAAIEVAAVSRDAHPGTNAEADLLLRRAEAVAARRGGAGAAREAAELAGAADRLWRAVQR